MATGIAEARELDAPTTEDLIQTHDMALTLLFRLLFISYAEDRLLLPYGENDEYTKVALKTLAKSFIPLEENLEFDSDSTKLWTNVASIVKAIHDGREEWSIPAYGGTPFTEDKSIKPSGARLAEIELDDSVFGPILQGLLIDKGVGDEIGSIDFRELSVREFGTIYEGLLESKLELATEDLAEDTKGYYRPARGNDVVVVESGKFFLHNSGKRKSSASYYTKAFAVEHILDSSLESALDDHLERIDAIADEEEASKYFFDFRIADISMGSGHFLIAAIDHIERRFSNYLSKRPLEGIMDELNRLWRLASERTGKDAESMGIDHNQLLRRQIARRCVYGVDINPTAVELAKVSVWIHTFVPGIPLSFLDWRLRCGNSIIGIATQEEANDIINEHAAQSSLFRDWQGDPIDEVAEIAQQMGEIGEGSDTTLEEVSEAMDNYRITRNKLRPWKALMDVMCASKLENDIKDKIGRVVRNWKAGANSVEQDDIWPMVERTLAPTQVFHFQIEFPEVFWRENPGFDVIIGNPPWKIPHLEEDQYYARFSPGFKTLSKQDKILRISELINKNPSIGTNLEKEKADMENIRNSIKKSGYPGVGSGNGHSDLYQVFAWRFWKLTRNSGHIGIIIPRSLFSSNGMVEWRKEAIYNSITKIVYCKNRREWLFDDVNAGYPICFVTMIKRVGDNPEIDIRGVANSETDFISIVSEDNVHVNPNDLKFLIGSNYSIPVIKSNSELLLTEYLRSFPSIGSSDRTDNSYLILNQELNATNDSDIFSQSENNYPIYNHKNVLQFIFSTEPGEYNNSTEEDILKRIYEKRQRLRSVRGILSPEDIAGHENLPFLKPRLVFRDVVHSTNSRKIWICLAPARTTFTHSAPVTEFPSDTIDFQAYLLGVMNSSLINWLGHQVVNLHLTYEIFKSLPLPIFNPKNPIHSEICEIAGKIAISGGFDYGAWEKRFFPPMEFNKELQYKLEALCMVAFELGVKDVSFLKSFYKTDEINRIEFYIGELNE